MKKYCFYKDKIYFLGYIVLSKGISIKAKRIKVVKNWLELKSVYNIQIFLGFANFYWRFIQGFRRIVAPFTLILKTIKLSDESAPKKNNGSKSASSKNDNNRPVTGKNNGDNKFDRFGVSKNGVKHAEKLGKLFKSRKSKSEKISKSQNLAKLEKKLLKRGNLTYFDAMEAGPKFLTPDAKISL